MSINKVYVWQINKVIKSNSKKGKERSYSEKNNEHSEKPNLDSYQLNALNSQNMKQLIYKDLSRIYS